MKLSKQISRFFFPLSTLKFLWNMRIHGVFNAVNQLAATQEDLSNVVTLRAGNKKVHYILNPNLLPDILRSPEVFQKPPGYSDLLSLFGKTGIGTSRYKMWKQQKETLRPFFLKKSRKSFNAGMQEEVSALLDKWSVDGSTKDIYEDLRNLSLGILFKTLFKEDIHDIRDDLKNNVDILNKFLLTSMLNPLTHVFRRHVVMGQKDRAAIAFMQEFMEKLTGQYESQYQENNLISKILKSSGYYDAQTAKDKQDTKMQAYEEIWQIAVAGYETTASALTWILIELAQHPETQESLLNEIDKELGDAAPHSDNVSVLKSQKDFIAEVLRFYPALHTSIPRIATADMEVGSGDEKFLIKKWEYVLIPIENMQRDPRWFQDPDKFDPERMKPESKLGCPKDAYMPFFAGAHSCSGQQMFFQEAMILVTETLRRVRPVLNGPRPQKVYKTTIVPEYGCKMSFEVRPEREISHSPQNTPALVIPHRKLSKGEGCPFNH